MTIFPVKLLQFLLGLGAGAGDFLDDVGDWRIGMFDDEDFTDITFLVQQLLQEAVAFIAHTGLTPDRGWENLLDRRAARHSQHAHQPCSIDPSPSVAIQIQRIDPLLLLRSHHGHKARQERSRFIWGEHLIAARRFPAYRWCCENF